ncbi:hypothetical protein NE850_38650 [Paraburkholderia sp. USG1]|uniref:TRAFAC clade GTPase domain-containing protein n=1 Tax=Paraburkholderia sp. USG1 TaxID=2952268 RepID=UPI002865C9FE|nr:hypothetical protein [Paraburkholderia sp. USG1]MDR8402241.1 hypothetical protein [Paraburkholderia sp. USG1]
MEQVQLILGMPSSGKSTFIAALGEVLMSDDVESSFKTEFLDDAQKHMVALHDRWLTFQELDRTKTGQENWLSFHLIARDGTRALIQLPDLSGESIRDAVVTGLYPNELHDALADCNGILLFTKTSTKFDDVLLYEVSDLIQASPTETAAEPAAETTASSQPEDGKPTNDAKTPPVAPRFSAQDMPEQPKIVQLLQTVTDLRPAKRRRLAIILSAWDTVDDSVTPDEWFDQNRTMLAQYLESNESHWDVRVYGISAQGGSLPRDKKRLQKIIKPSERVSIVGHGALTHDLCAPIKWLMQNPSGPV